MRVNRSGYPMAHGALLGTFHIAIPIKEKGPCSLVIGPCMSGVPLSF